MHEGSRVKLAGKRLTDGRFTELRTIGRVYDPCGKDQALQLDGTATCEPAEGGESYQEGHRARYSS